MIEHSNAFEPEGPVKNGEVQPFISLAQGLLAALIANEPDPSERMARIMIANEHGHLTEGEAEAWIVLVRLAQT